MCESKMHDLLEGTWAGKEGNDALRFFIEVVGLDLLSDGSDLLQEAVAVRDTQIVGTSPFSFSLFS